MKKQTAIATEPPKITEGIFSMDGADKGLVLGQHGIDAKLFPGSIAEGKKAFEELHKEVADNIKAFVHIGEVLMRIKNGGLYLPMFAKDKGADNFTEYLKKTWANCERPLQIVGACDTRDVIIKKLGIAAETADKIWAYEAHYYKIRQQVKMLVANGELTTEGKAFKSSSASIIAKNKDADAKTLRELLDEQLAKDTGSSSPEEMDLNASGDALVKQVETAAKAIAGNLRSRVKGLYLDVGACKNLNDDAKEKFADELIVSIKRIINEIKNKQFSYKPVPPAPKIGKAKTAKGKRGKKDNAALVAASRNSEAENAKLQQGRQSIIGGLNPKSDGKPEAPLPQKRAKKPNLKRY